MKKHIAIIGRAGSGKDYVVSQLLTVFSMLKEKYGECRRFAFADAPKQHISVLLNLNDEQFKKLMHDEVFKNNSLVDIKNMKLIVESDVEHTHPGWHDVVSAINLDSQKLQYEDIDEYKNWCNDNLYMTLRDFMVFYGTNVIQKCLGRKVWCNKVFNSNLYQFVQDQGDDKGIAIITDVRFPHEYESCKEKGFVFVKIEDVSENRVGKMNNIAESYTDMFQYDYLFENDKDSPKNFADNFRKLIIWINDGKD